MTDPTDHLLHFVVDHEACGPDLRIKRVDGDQDARIVLICSGCGARLAVPVTPPEALEFVQRAATLSTEDLERARRRVRKH